ncbi:MAG: DUF134 domain-containing protein [Clostridia bacterium]
MSRPIKCRKVCSMPKCKRFGTLEATEASEICMSVEEYEAIRLIDKMSFTQEEASLQMNIARTTLQRIYDSARKKIAEAIVCGNVLSINGGTYTLCDGNELSCRCGGCEKHKKFNEE